MDDAHTCKSHGRRRVCCQRNDAGFTLIEMLIAVTVVSMGVAATLKVFGSAGRTTLSAQAQHVAVQQLQGELEQLASLPYSELAMTTAPESSPDPRHPGSKVAGGSFNVRSGLSEDLVMTPGDGATAKVVPGPTPFAVGSGGATITGRLYRYVTWRDETCLLSLCPGIEDTKRITLAATIDAPFRPSDRPPVWISTIVADPTAAPPGASAPPGGTPHGGPPVTAQSFYLSDTPCSQTTRQTPAADHETRDTAARGPAPEDNSTCEHPDTARQPDLMTTDVPAGDAEDELFRYSSDLEGPYYGGLATKPAGSSCTSSYEPGVTDPEVPSRWNVHAWSTPPMPQLFHMDGQVTVSLFTVSIGGVPASGRLCATLIDQSVTGGVPTDRVIGESTYDLTAWPRSVRRVTFTFQLPLAQDILAGQRLVLVLHAHGQSTEDLLFAYDHPAYPSLLEVATTTPL
jgi:prepilin-type N-terminal cleavage/methylation domain-containing protein